MTLTDWSQRFSAYFSKEVAQKAAQSISNGAEVEFHVLGDQGESIEVFTFTKADGKNQIKASAAKDPQIIFQMPHRAAEQILADPAEEIGPIGVNILKLLLNQDPQKRVALRLNAGFLTLFGKGYLGVVTAGGTEFASFLASKGFNGMGAIKAALKKLKG